MNLDMNDLDRACSECGTKDTPLWRLGPNGPKSMCNACGIRWKRGHGSNKKKKRTSVIVSVEPKIAKKKLKVKDSSQNLALAINEEYNELSRRLLPSQDDQGFPRSSLHSMSDEPSSTTMHTAVTDIF